MNTIASLFQSLNEPFAQGFFEQPEKELFVRFSRAQRRYWESVPLPDYCGEPIYPCGQLPHDNMAVIPSYSFTYHADLSSLKQKSEKAAAMVEQHMPVCTISGPHTVGGAGYTHSLPNYPRIVKEGLDSYEARIRCMKSFSMQEGLLDLLHGLRIYHHRIIRHLSDAGANEKLIKALQNVPFKPASTWYEALLCRNFIFYIDGCDNPGRLDVDLQEYPKDEHTVRLLRAFFKNVDENNGWSAAIGPNYNEMSRLCLKAIKGFRRPSLELRVEKDMPDELWDLAAQAIASGCGQPSFYNERLYQSALLERFPDLTREDSKRFCGGGCTETMLEGISNVGSLDAGINTALVLVEVMKSDLVRTKTYDEFYEILMQRLSTVITSVLQEINQYQKCRQERRPHPVRTLLIDDCIDREKDFHAGGARHRWSVVNVAGLINVIDSLQAIKTLIFDRKLYTAQSFLEKLTCQDPAFVTACSKCPRYGTDDDVADAPAVNFVHRVFAMFNDVQPYSGGAFLPASIQFTTYASAGFHVSATPDGRSDKDPLCDSIGPLSDTVSKGPTALLLSAAKLPQQNALGTPVLNLRLDKEAVMHHLRALVQTYFESGGMQIQINCVSNEDLIDAMHHPEKHQDLIVRIGGYSEYFTRLPKELQQSVLKRQAHGISDSLHNADRYI